MGKLGFGSAPNIGFDILPKTIVIADSFAPGANGNDALQGFYLLGGRFEIELGIDQPVIGCGSQYHFPEIEGNERGTTY